MTDEQKRERHKELGRRAFTLLKTAVEVRNGNIRDDGSLPNDTLDVRLAVFTMVRDGMLSRAAIINGELFVSALDAATMDGRDKQRMLVVARAVTDA